MEKVSKGVEYILRCAIAKGGSVGYNPYKRSSDLNRRGNQGIW